MLLIVALISVKSSRMLFLQPQSENLFTANYSVQRKSSVKTNCENALTVRVKNPILARRCLCDINKMRAAAIFYSEVYKY